MILVVVLQESGSRFYVSPSIKSTNFIFNDKSTQIVPSDRSETRKHISLSWCINELFKKRLAIREILLIAVVILFALAFLMAMVFSKNQRKSTPCTEGKWQLCRRHTVSVEYSIVLEENRKRIEPHSQRFGVCRRTVVQLLVIVYLASVNQSVKGSDGICASARWIQSAVTVAGGKGRGLRIDQFSGPNGLFFDENGTLYVADTFNHRITKWAHAASTGSVVAGGKGNGSSSEQLNLPVDVVVDENGTLYVVDTLNRRVQQWFAHASSGQPIIGNLSVSGIARDDQGSLYTCDWTENQVRKWQKDDTVGQILVFGLAYAKRLYVDSSHSVYVSDTNNHRVIKIDQGTSEPSVVAGGSFGTELHQLNYPESVKVDRLGNVYVADTRNHRIMRWQVGATSGTLIAGGRGNGSRSDQLNNPTDIQFDRDGNLYAADAANHRVQKFLLDKSSC